MISVYLKDMYCPPECHLKGSSDTSTLFHVACNHWALCLEGELGDRSPLTMLLDLGLGSHHPNSSSWGQRGVKRASAVPTQSQHPEVEQLLSSEVHLSELTKQYVCMWRRGRYVCTYVCMLISVLRS